MKLVIVGLVVLLLLGGGGAFVFLKKDELLGGEEAEEKTGTVASYLRAPVHFEMKLLAVPVIRDGRVERHVILRIKPELTDEEARQETSRRSARLQDAYIASLYDYYSYVTPGKGTPNVAALNKRLMRETERALGRGLVKKISIKGAVQDRSTRK